MVAVLRWLTRRRPRAAPKISLRPKSYNALKVAMAAIFFGSDWPVCDLAGGLGPWLTAINALLGGVSIADRQKLFVSNAARIYRLG
jgi:predicted TIM-barrel fold metal-dependent hydrolase